MMECDHDTQEVTVSGTVGKQVFASNGSAKKVKLLGFVLTPSGTSAGSVTIKSGNASGDTKFFARGLANTSRPYYCKMRFDRGMHVKCLGGATCYLLIA